MERQKADPSSGRDSGSRKLLTPHAEASRPFRQCRAPNPTPFSPLLRSLLSSGFLLRGFLGGLLLGGGFFLRRRFLRGFLLGLPWRKLPIHDPFPFRIAGQGCGERTPFLADPLLDYVRFALLEELAWRWGVSTMCIAEQKNHVR